MFNYFFAFFLLVASCLGQRPSYAGRNPIGYPSLETATSSSADGLGDRFGNDEGTTQTLPLEALGERDLVNRLNKLPMDKQPFWFLNWKALEESRKLPQTYPLRPNPFINPIPTNQFNQIPQNKNSQFNQIPQNKNRQINFNKKFTEKLNLY